jgi:tRNA uridine 5-carboxymethylaminomethyl modification enzyme
VPAGWAERVLRGPLTREASAFELLRRPEVSYEALLELTGPPPWLVAGSAASADDRLPGQVRTHIEVHARYAGYIERAHGEIERARRNEETALPDDLDYSRLAGLSHEVRQRLTEVRPATLGQAARIPGVTAAAISILLVHLKKRSLAASPQVA